MTSTSAPQPKTKRLWQRADGGRWGSLTRAHTSAFYSSSSRVDSSSQPACQCQQQQHGCRMNRPEAASPALQGTVPSACTRVTEHPCAALRAVVPASTASKACILRLYAPYPPSTESHCARRRWPHPPRQGATPARNGIEGLAQNKLAQAIFAWAFSSVARTIIQACASAPKAHWGVSRCGARGGHHSAAGRRASCRTYGHTKHAEAFERQGTAVHICGHDRSA